MSTTLADLGARPNASHPVVEGLELALQDGKVLALIEGILTQHVKLEADELKRLREQAGETAKYKQELQQAQARIRELEGR